MRKINKNIWIMILFLGLIFANYSVSAEPNVDASVTPSEPTVGENVKFTADVENMVDIQDVRIIIQECKGVDICYLKVNESMSYINDTYEYELNLQHSDATIVKYYFEIYNQTSMFKTKTYETTLKENSDSNGETNPDNSENDTPGFELIALFIAFSIMLVIYRKRLK